MVSGEEIIAEIKKKKELRGTATEVVREALAEYLSKNKISLDNLSPKQQKLVVKEIRSKLRLLVGRFQNSSEKRKSLLSKQDFNELLNTHVSTKERLDFYPKLKQIISDLNVKSILDLGCGLNPIALATEKIKYYAADINEADLEIVREYFKQNKIKGNVFVQDLRNIQSELPKTDLCIILKVLDIIDPKHNLSGKILEKISAKNLIISFSTRKLSGKKMNFPRRFWFEKLLTSQKLTYKTLESSNELFYLISRQ